MIPKRFYPAYVQINHQTERQEKDKMLKSIESLNLGFSDAQNYTQRGNKQILSEVFVKNAYLTKLLRANVYYLIGEKGTGKTAYAAFLSNSEYNNNKSVLKFISGTDYEKFYELKKRKQIDISGYVRFLYKGIIINHNKNRASLH